MKGKKGGTGNVWSATRGTIDSVRSDAGEFAVLTNWRRKGGVGVGKCTSPPPRIVRDKKRGTKITSLCEGIPARSMRFLM